MNIDHLTVYRGRNIYCHRPVIKMIVDIGEFANTPTKDIAGFNKKLLNIFPGVAKHTCGLGYEGGFLERLNEGTYLAHVLEHVIIEMQCQLGFDIKYGKTRVIKEPSKYYIVFEYRNEVCAVECATYALNIFNDLICGKEFNNIENIYAELKKLDLDSQPGPSTSAIIAEAEKRGIAVTKLDADGFIQLGYGRYKRIIECTITDATSCISVDIATNKELTKTILSNNKIPVPFGKLAYSENSAVSIAKQLGTPIVIKPYNGNKGKGVNLRLTHEEDIRNAYKEAQKICKTVIVEEYIPGRDYRILVVNNNVCAASERIPPCVIGNGIDTIENLVENENKNPLRGEDHEKPLTIIKLDDTANEVLKKAGLTIYSVPKVDEVIYLRENGNISTGGTAVDCTDIIHPINCDIAVRATKAIGLEIAGIDMVTEDISKPITEIGGAIVEVNAAPGLRMHIYPNVGKSRDVAKDIVDMLFPDKNYHIPIVSVTGTNGKTTTTRMISHVLQLTGKTVGMTTTSGVFINGQCLLKGDNTGPVSARLLLSQQIDTAVLETARGGIVRGGLGYDLADVGVITNISDDHLGMDGIETIDDLAFAKSLVIEAVKPSGYAVLNYDDPMTSNLLPKVKSKVILFSKTKPIFEKDNIYVYNDCGSIYINDGKINIDLAKIDEVPMTIGGIADFNIENLMATISALYALNVSIEIIREGIKSFEADTKHNLGRFNIIEVGDYSVILDYGHNRSGYEAVLNAVNRLSYNRLIGVIGAPGDRKDSCFKDIAKLCSNSFDSIYIKEDKDLRGRNSGEVSSIFLNELINFGFSKSNTKTILSETDALKSAMNEARSGDIIVVFYEDVDSLLQIINQYKESLVLV